MRVYGTRDGVIPLGAFYDLIAVHEVAHLFAEERMRFPRLWLGELFANLCLDAWVHRRSPESLEILLTLPRLGSMAPAEEFDRRTRQQFESDYSAMSAPNYVWYQFRLQMAAAALFESSGEAGVQRLFRAFPIDDESSPGNDIDDEQLAKLLSDRVDPVLGAFALDF